MNKEFNDIFESINLMHKKYSSKEYLDSIDNFSSSSKEFEEMMEKFNTDVYQAKHKEKFSLFKRFGKKKNSGV